jgi:pimeloyl-ACP methyl ester carboxylesterase
VHGGFHGAWCWAKLAPPLEAPGHRVFGPSLPGLGDRAAELTADIGLSTHVADIADLIEREDLREVILLGHSYGAMVITGAADRVPDRIGHLVYVDTFVPRDGESMQDIVPLEINRFRREARAHGDGWRVDPPRELPFARRGSTGSPRSLT